jgi:hypothetical protein
LQKEDVKKALAFLNDPKFLQDVAYGSKPLTIGPGKVIKIPNPNPHNPNHSHSLTHSP